MSLFKKRFPTLEEQISRLSPKCRELTDEESRLVNGGGPSVWDTYNGTGCPYEYTTVPKDPPAETTTPASNTPANKTTEIAETTATDTSNQSDNNSATDSQDFSHSSGTFYSDSKTEKTNPIYFTRACDAAMIAEEKGKAESENKKQITILSSKVSSKTAKIQKNNGYLQIPQYTTEGYNIIDKRKDFLAKTVNNKVLEEINLITEDNSTIFPDPDSSNSIRFSQPTVGKISSEFGKRDIIKVNETNTKSFHSGIDIANDAGTPIYPIAEGTVLECGSNESYGNYIIIGHDTDGWNGLYSLYAHLQEMTDFQTGDVVSSIQQIGTMGQTALATGPHLHLEIKNNNIKYNPRDFISF